MYLHETTYRIPYPEVDRLNVVHHSHYAKYYEIGRLETLRSLGWDYRKMEDEGVGLFVAEMRCRFLRPARYDEVIRIKTVLPQLPGRRILFETEIYNHEHEVCNIGTVKLLFVDKRNMQVCSPPAALRKLLLPFFKDEH